VSEWSLGIDFGTSFTAAAVAQDGERRVVDIEGNGASRIPSATFLTSDGTILVGGAAQEQATLAPERYEPTPKRAFGEARIFLGDRLVEVTELTGALLAHVYGEACRMQGGGPPAELRLTYPTGWAEVRRAVLLEACRRGGLPAPELIPEAVAAAVELALAATAPGRHIAVYDYGGGTFDAAVLLRTATGFEIAGPPLGRDPLGGEDIDQRILGYIGGVLEPEYAERWQALLEPADAQSRQRTAALRAEVQRAKEELSDEAACQLALPGIERDVQLTRQELEDLIRDDVSATVEVLATALAQAGVESKDLAGLYLVGGSSRIPLVSDMLWTRLGIEPTLGGEPKAVVASGAAAWTRAARETATQQAAPTPEPPPAGGAQAGAAPAALAAPSPLPATPLTPPPAQAAHLDGAAFRPRLAVTLSAAPGADGEICAGALVLERAGTPPLTLHLSDEPARGRDTAALAAEASSAQTDPGFHEDSSGPAVVAGRDGGIERRFTTVHDGREAAMLEQYLVVDERALVITGPEEARALVQAITLGEPPRGDRSSYRIRAELPLPAGWSATEHVSLTAAGSSHPVLAERFVGDADAVAARRDDLLDELMDRPSARRALRSAVRLFDTVPGEVVTVTWRDGRTHMVTRLGLASTDEEAYSLEVTLPHAEQQRFGALSERAFLHEPGAVVPGS
jgi:molecular chaperone DnaK